MHEIDQSSGSAAASREGRAGRWGLRGIIGALLVLGFLRFGLPPEDRIQLQDLPAFNLAIFLGYLFVSFTVASYFTLRMLIPVMRWQRRDMLLGDRDPADTEVARELQTLHVSSLAEREQDLRAWLDTPT